MYTFPLSVAERRLFYIGGAIIVTIPNLILAGLGVTAPRIGLTLAELLQVAPQLRIALAFVFVLAMGWLYAFVSYMMISEGQSLRIENGRLVYFRPGLALGFGLLKREVTLEASRVKSLSLAPSVVPGVNWDRCDLIVSDGSKSIVVPVHRASNESGDPVHHSVSHGWQSHPVVREVERVTGCQARQA